MTQWYGNDKAPVPVPNRGFMAPTPNVSGPQNIGRQIPLGRPAPVDSPETIEQRRLSQYQATMDNISNAKSGMAGEMGITNPEILRRLQENTYGTPRIAQWTGMDTSGPGRQATKAAILIEQQLQDNIDAINNQFASLGRYGSPEHMKALARAEQATLLRRQDRQPHA